jgi:hypothetical protein
MTVTSTFHAINLIEWVALITSSLLFAVPAGHERSLMSAQLRPARIRGLGWVKGVSSGLHGCLTS